MACGTGGNYVPHRLPQTRGARLVSGPALRGRVGAYVTHSRHSGQEITSAARKKFLARFYDEVDPDRTLSEAERERRAAMARRAYFAKLQLRSAQVRRTKRARREGSQ